MNNGYAMYEVLLRLQTLFVTKDDTVKARNIARGASGGNTLVN